MAAETVERPPDLADRGGLLARYGGRLSRDVTIYVLGMVAVLPFSLIQAAVLTRLMEPSEYGTLAILLVFASFGTMLASLGTVHATFMYVYRSSDSDGADDFDGGADPGELAIDEPDGQPAVIEDKRTAMATGMWLLVATLVICITPTVILAPQIGQWLIHEDGAGDLVIWAALSGAASTLYRLAHNVLRMERRPFMFGFLNLMRPTLVVGLVTWLVATGGGVHGALVGMTIGTAITTVVAVLVSLKSWGLGFRWRHARGILRIGMAYAPMVLSMWGIHSADSFILSRYAVAADVGLYRLASRVASLPSYYVSAVLLTQSPMERSTLMRATYDRHGGPGWVRSQLFTFYAVGALFIVLVLSVGADVLVKIAAPSYADAAKLIPVVSLAFVVYGTFSIALRWGGIAHRRAWRIVLTVGAMLLYFAASIVLIPLVGTYGLPMAQMIGTGTATGVILWLASHQNRPDNLRPDWPRVAATVVVAAACWALGTQVAAALPQPFHVIVGVLSVAVFPAALVAVRVVPRRQLTVLSAAARNSIKSEGSGGRELISRVQTLPVRRRVIIESVVRDRQSVEQVAVLECVSPDVAAERLARAMRDLAGIPASKPEADAAVGWYVASLHASTAAHTAISLRLIDEGVDPLELYQLERLYVQLRRTPRRAWSRPLPLVRSPAT